MEWVEAGGWVTGVEVPRTLEELELEREQVFDGRLLKVWRDRVRLPNGAEGGREYIRHPGAVVILALQANGHILLERQFRYPLKRTFVELPAGKIDAGEDILECAQRELREETGFVAAEWTHVGVMHPCIGYSDERIEIFFARDLSHVGHNWDEGEFLEIFTLPVDAFERAVHGGEITDGKSIAAFYRCLPLIKATLG